MGEKDLIPKNNKKKNFDFKKIKTNTTNSLCEVETFLCNFKKSCTYYNLYKLLKK